MKGNVALGCGNGENYQLGLGNIGEFSEPVLLSLEADSVSATYNGTILVKHGNVSATGISNIGELGLPKGVY